MKSTKIIITLLLIGIFLWSFSRFLSVYAADYFYKKSQTLIQKGYFESAIKYSDYAIRLNPNEPNYYRGRAKVSLVAIPNFSEGTANNRSEKIHSKKLSILADLMAAYNINKSNLVVLRNSIPIYYFVAAEDLSQPASADNVDKEFLLYTQEFYKFMKQKYSTDLGVLVELAKYEKRLGFAEDYGLTIEMIEKLRPDVLEWHEDIIE